MGDANSEIELARKEPIPDLDDGQIVQINQWEAHKDVIKSIQYISSTDVPLVFTAGLDRMAYIWDLEKNCRGKLIQGYMLKTNYYWDFPLSHYASFAEARHNQIQETLQEVRVERDQDRTYKKQAQLAAMRYGNTFSSLGFNGAALLGNDYAQGEQT